MHLKRNQDYWVAKIEENMARDVWVDNELLKLGWRPMHFGAKDVPKNPDAYIARIIKSITSDL